MNALSTIVPSSNEDPDKLFICPFDATHLIKARIFNQHLLKCERNHGNHGLRTCTFNQSHRIPERGFERHLVECPDRFMIQQDLDAAQRRTNHSLPPVNHHPVWNKPESTEDWDSEVSMEHGIIPEAEQRQEVAVTNEAVDGDQFDMKELLPEFPHNWESMTATQKKNYRRRYNKQKEKMKERGLTASDFERSKDPRDWTEEERQAKLDLMVSLYPPPKVGGTFIDYKSILNQYCQKNKVNVPKYVEAPGTFGGFAAKVIVKGGDYESLGSHRTKKSAAQSAAMLALLAMPIPEQVEDNPTPKLRPARTANELQLLRTRHEIGMLHNAGQLQPQSMPVQQSRNINDTRNANSEDSRPSNVAPTLMTPQAFAQPNNDIVRSMQGVSLQSQRNSDDEWKTAGTRRHVARAGRGRGTTLSSFT